MTNPSHSQSHDLALFEAPQDVRGAASKMQVAWYLEPALFPLDEA